MPLLDSVKQILRISGSTTAFDEEIGDLIAAARDDLKLAGVIPEKASSDTDPLIKRAVSTYVKANFGYDNPDAARLQDSFCMIKMHLTLSQEYTGYVVTFTVTAGSNPLEDVFVTFNGKQQITDTAGTTMFTGIRKEQNMEYTVTLDGYTTASGKVDVNGNKAVAVALAVGA